MAHGNFIVGPSLLSAGKEASKHASDLGNDSAISVGSTSEDEVPPSSAGAGAGKKKSKKSRRDNSRTLTERDVKHLERHLSMKKTIRKKIMRDLQQAFVEDPTEFRVEDISHEQLIQSLSFGTPGRGQKASRHAAKESNFLDMLRTNSGGTPHGTAHGPPHAAPLPLGLEHGMGGMGGTAPCDDHDSGHGSPRGSPTRDLSTDRDRDRNRPPPAAHHDDYDDGPVEDAGKKTSFWRRFTMKGRNKR